MNKYLIISIVIPVALLSQHYISVCSMSIESNKIETHQHHRRHQKLLGQTVKSEQNDDDDNSNHHIQHEKFNENQNGHATKIPSNCPKCQNRQNQIRMTEEELTELRIEYVKNQILKKLKLTERPQVSVSLSNGLPKPVAEGATFLTDSDEDSITGIPDEFYGKTTQKIIFPQLDSEHCRDLGVIGSSMCFSIQIPADIDHNDVESAELWVYKEPHVIDTNKHSFLIGEVVETWDSKDIYTQKPFAIQETNVTEEWVKIDIAWKIKNWIEENDLEHVIDISCNTCEKHPSMDMLSLDQGYRPFIVINTHPSRKIKRQRRSVNCSPGVTECCREKLYISFADIGWDDWILYPPGYHAYFCRGSCGTAAAITLSGSYYNSVIRNFPIKFCVCYLPIKSFTVPYWLVPQFIEIEMDENGMSALSTPTSTTDTRAEMVNENRNIFTSGNINNKQLNDGNESKLIEDSRITMTKELFLCRICYSYDQIHRFISPCDKQCLERWLSRAGILHCELCTFRFRTECTLRYSCCQAIRLWYKHPNHRGLMQSDALLCSTLTVIILALLAIVCFGLDYFIPEGQEYRFSDKWMFGTTIVLLVVSVMAYLLFLTFMIRQQLCPSYRWWRSSRIVRVILPDVINRNNFKNQEFSKN